jgi:hypothetical protein
MEHEPDRDEPARPVTQSPAPQEAAPQQGGSGLSGAAEDEAGARRATGEPRVDAALRLLDRLPGLPVSDHPELFEQVHAQLTDVLGELDSSSAGPADAHGS